MPPLSSGTLWSAQIRAIQSLERSLAGGDRRALIQMATGSGKTFTAVNFIYRLVKYAGAKRVLFLVDRGNLGEQTLGEFQQFVSPANNYKFTEEFIVQHLRSSTLDTSARVVISTIQRLYSMLKGEQNPAPDLDDLSIDAAESLFKAPLPIEYNAAYPIETFDVIVTDECHRSIYNLWRQVLEYFDATLIGLTATPSNATRSAAATSCRSRAKASSESARRVIVGAGVWARSPRSLGWNRPSCTPKSFTRETLARAADQAGTGL